MTGMINLLIPIILCTRYMDRCEDRCDDRYMDRCDDRCDDRCSDDYSCDSISDSTYECHDKQKTIEARDIGDFSFFLSTQGVGFLAVTPEEVGFTRERFTDCDQLYVGYCYTGINGTSGLPIPNGTLDGRVAVFLQLAEGVDCGGAVIRLYTPQDIRSNDVNGLTAFIFPTVNCSTRIAFTLEECAAMNLVRNGNNYNLDVFLPNIPVTGTVINTELATGITLTTNIQRREITRICDKGIVRDLIENIRRLLRSSIIRPRRDQMIHLARQVCADVARKRFGRMICDDPKLLTMMIGGYSDCRPCADNTKCEPNSDKEFISRFECLEIGGAYKESCYRSEKVCEERVCESTEHSREPICTYEGNSGCPQPRADRYERCEEDVCYVGGNNDCIEPRGGDCNQYATGECQTEYVAKEQCVEKRHQGECWDGCECYISTCSDASGFARVTSCLYTGLDYECENDFIRPNEQTGGNCMQRPIVPCEPTTNTYGDCERQVEGYGENTFDNVIVSLFKTNLLCKLAFAKEGLCAETGLMSNKCFDTLLQTNMADTAVREAVDNLYIASCYPALKTDNTYDALQTFCQKFSGKNLFNLNELLASIKSEDVRNQLLGCKLDILKMLSGTNLEEVVRLPVTVVEPVKEPKEMEEQVIVEEDSEYESDYNDSEESMSDDSSSADFVRRPPPKEEGTSLGTKVVYGGIALTVIATVATAVFYFI